jgi:hypothetical protein
VDLELLQHLPAEGTLGQHALHRQAQHALGIALHQAGQRLRPEPAGVLRVAVVALVRTLLGVDGDPGGVDDDNEIARIDMRGVDRLVLAPQDAGDLAGEAAEDHAVGVDEVPGASDVCLFGREGPHPGVPFMGRGQVDKASSERRRSDNQR